MLEPTPFNVPDYYNTNVRSAGFLRVLLIRLGTAGSFEDTEL